MALEEKQSKKYDDKAVKITYSQNKENTHTNENNRQLVFISEIHEKILNVFHSNW